MGILFSLTALFSWGLGDFLIQRSARKFGDWIALFFVTAFATIVLFPFVATDIGDAFRSHGLLLTGMSLVIFVAALFDFEALREGKISVIEPVYALEIPLTGLLAAIVIRERLSVVQTALIIGSFVGIFLISTRSFSHLKSIHLERGVWYGFIATMGMGVSNFLFGIGSRELNPLMINFVTSLFMSAVSLIYILVEGRGKEAWRDFRRHKRLIMNMGFFDVMAWVTYSYACLYIPIAIATSISEAYIVLASALGLVFNHEKLRRHQFFGFFLAVTSLIILAVITDK